MNMKLLTLLATLLALSFANSDMTVNTFSEILHQLEELETYPFNALDESVYIQTPRNIRNACECKDSFAKHLKDFLTSCKSVIPRDQRKNILDNLQHFTRLRPVKAKDNCNFTKHHLTRLTSNHLQKFIQDNIEFIQNWNAHCKP